MTVLGSELAQLFTETRLFFSDERKGHAMIMRCVATVCLLSLGLGAPLLAQTQAQLNAKLNDARRALFDQKFEQAQKLFDQVLTSDPDNLEAQVGKMDAMGGQRKVADVNAFAKQKAQDTSLQGLVIDANNRFWSRDLQGAEKQLRQAVAKAPNNYFANYMLGYLLNRTRRPDEAIQYLQKAIAANPDFPESYYVLGDVHFAKKNSDQVLKYWREYLSRIPRSGSRFDYVNNTLKKLGGN